MGEVPGPGNDFSDALLRLVNDVNVNIEGGDILLSEAWELGSGCCGDNVVVEMLWPIKEVGEHGENSVVVECVDIVAD